MDRPIIFSAPEVRALLAGRKTMTRRVLKLPTKTSGKDAHRIYEHPKMGGWEPTTSGGGGCFTIARDGSRVPAPERVAIWHRTCGICIETPWQVGDRFWVRENWWHDAEGGDEANEYGFLADEHYPCHGDNDGHVRHRSSAIMPRWASRLTLDVTDVRVERLQAISEEDAISEGLARSRHGNEDQWCEYPLGSSAAGWIDPRDSFRSLWNSLHGSGAWDADPWVAAISFTVRHANIDALDRAA